MRRQSPPKDGIITRLLASPHVRNGALALVMLIVIGIAVAAMLHILHETTWAQIRAALHRIGWGNLAASLLLTALSYFVLTGYDLISLHILGRRVPYRTAALASFTSYIFSHNFGFAVLTGGTARYRIYGRAGLRLSEVAQVMALTGITFWLGVFLMLAIALIAMPDLFAAEGFALPYHYQAGIGAIILIGLAAYLVLLHYRAGRPVALFGWSLILPTWRIAIVQFGLAALDISLATAALFVLVPGLPPAAFPDMLIGYIVAFVSGLITHAPGGVGVFETVMLVSLPRVDRAALFAALLAYRFIYYLLPLAVGLGLFLIHELGTRIAGRRPRPAG